MSSYLAIGQSVLSFKTMLTYKWLINQKGRLAVVRRFLQKKIELMRRRFLMTGSRTITDIFLLGQLL